LYRNDRTTILNAHTATSRDVLLSSPSKDVDLFLKRFFDFVVSFLDRFCDLPDLIV
jgi:hypothetical protein